MVAADEALHAEVTPLYCRDAHGAHRVHVEGVGTSAAATVAALAPEVVRVSARNW